jgi:hypothetical protein
MKFYILAALLAKSKTAYISMKSLEGKIFLSSFKKIKKILFTEFIQFKNDDLFIID